MKFDRPLCVGAQGGHGPIRYTVEAYAPGRSIRFRFTGPRGFDGWHGLAVLDATSACAVLEHRLEMRIHGIALFTWPLLYRHLHDALLEDALASAQLALGEAPRRVPWPRYVRLLRWLLAPRTPHRAGGAAGAVRRLSRRHAGRTSCPRPQGCAAAQGTIRRVE